MTICMNKRFDGHLEERSSSGSYMFGIQSSFVHSFMPLIVTYNTIIWELIWDHVIGRFLRKMNYDLCQMFLFDILPYIIGIILENLHENIWT